jgi:hypothetical protein
LRTLYVRNPHLKGPRVAEVQRLLKHAGHDPGPIDGDFGPHTAQACKDAKKFTYGYTVVGCQPTCGDLLLAYLKGTLRPTVVMRARAALRRRQRAQKPMHLKALAFARADVGIVETQVNIIKYNDWWTNGHNDHQPYCVRAGSYWYAKAGSKSIDRAAGRFQGTDYMLACAKQDTCGVTTTNSPVPGDLFVIDFDGHTDPDHCGMVEEMKSDGVHSIEANATLPSGAQGVGRHVRPRGNVWFIRLVK